MGVFDSKKNEVPSNEVPKTELITPVDINAELNNIVPSTESNILGQKNTGRPKPAEEKLPEVKPTTDRIVYFSKYKGLRIGIRPAMDTFEYIEGIKRKISVPGHQIKFNNGRYVCQIGAAETEAEFFKRKGIEEKFLEDFGKRYPDKIFTIDPKRSAILKKLQMLEAEERRIAAGESVRIPTGGQGPSGNKG